MKMLKTLCSCNNNMQLWLTAKSYTDKKYLYNVYSKLYWQSDEQLKFHRKLKVYEQMQHGYYVVCNGTRCYCNCLIRI